MKSCSTNEVKIYNLSAGKALPEWLVEKKRRLMKKKGARSTNSVELIQDFEMPGVSTSVQVTPDGNYILATGIYKPRVRCYDVKNLSMKFERCFDSEVVKFAILSQDYSKVVFLQCDRYVEFHAQYGKYYRMRIPHFGRDLAYHSPSCDLYVVGASNEAYRINLELGRFNTPIVTESSCINTCRVNPVHHLVTFGTVEGKVLAVDPRAGKLAGDFDVVEHYVSQNKTVPAITSMAYKDGLKLGVGTSTGHVLIYDIRSSKPLLVKDHYYCEPIKSLEFLKDADLVMSMDRRVIKIWNEEDGKPFTAVESGETDFNELCIVPGTGMFFAANEDRRIQSYYAPVIGPAPRWCSFLDSLTEELEESSVKSVYDDYKFVTEKELAELGLGNLIGTNLLRGYMHGYFMDMRLYSKAKSVAQPFQFEEFKHKKLKEKMESERKNRVKLNTLPQVNKDLALKLMTEPPKSKGGNLLQDDRFKAMFQNPDFQVDKSAEEFRLLNPIISSRELKRSKKLEKAFATVQETPEVEGKGSSDEDEEDSSDDDDRQWVDEVRKERNKIRNEKRMEEYEMGAPKFYEIKPGEDFKMSDMDAKSNRRKKVSLGERVQSESMDNIKTKDPFGGREMSFSMRSRKKDNSRMQQQKHHEERKGVRRSAGGLRSKKNSWKK